jgi:hypothetical protein
MVLVTTPQPTFWDGPAIKARILGAHDANWAPLLRNLRLYLYSLAIEGAEVTSDDAHHYLDANRICVGGDRRWLGALWAEDEGIAWQACGWRPSTRSINHARPIRVWRLRA